jgi:hypothetical protein
MWCNTSSRPNHHAPVPSERCLRMHIIRMLGLHSVAEFGPAGLDVIDPGCKGHVGRNRQAEPTRLDDCALAPKDLHAVSGLTGRLWVRLAVGPRLPQRGPDITWIETIASSVGGGQREQLCRHFDRRAYVNQHHAQHSTGQDRVQVPWRHARERRPR